jgi:hypothetical protein
VRYLLNLRRRGRSLHLTVVAAAKVSVSWPHVHDWMRPSGLPRLIGIGSPDAHGKKVRLIRCVVPTSPRT